MHKNIFFLSFILFFCSLVFGSEKRSISPITQAQLDTDLRNSISYENFTDFLTALNNGAQVNNKGVRGHTALHLAAMMAGLSEHKDDIIKKLVEYKADTNLQNHLLETPLYTYICRNPKEGIVALLLDAKANPDIANYTPEKDSPLTLVEDQKIIDVFLNKGWLPTHTSLSLAIQYVQPHLLPFIPIKPLTEIILSYLVEKDGT